MSLFNTLNTGASGLGVSQRGLAVIGDNIANINTTGYKGGRASFADALPQSVGTLGGIAQVGNGALTSDVSFIFGQGMLQDSGSPLDVAIQGRGFFQVANGAESFYTRDGSFRVDSEGWMVNAQGLRVQGYGATDGQLTTANGDVQISSEPIPPLPTTSITFDLNLSAKADSSTTPLATSMATGLNGAANGIEIMQLSQEADFSTSVDVYDSLGVAHTVSVFFEKQPGANTWTWSADIDGGSIDGAAAGTDGTALEIASGTVGFTTTGEITSFTQSAGATAWNWPGADPYTFDMQLGLDASGNPNAGSATQWDSSSSVTRVEQDGRTIGDLTSVRVDADGVIQGTYSNGEELQLGQLTLALFQADNGLERIGGNLWRATLQSGEAAIGVAGTGGRGATIGNALERSNVELEDQFVNMIQTQRSYQANAGVVKTADETLQTLVNLV